MVKVCTYSAIPMCPSAKAHLRPEGKSNWEAMMSRLHRYSIELLHGIAHYLYLRYGLPRSRVTRIGLVNMLDVMRSLPAPCHGYATSPISRHIR
jgi:hypothetical protein